MIQIENLSRQYRGGVRALHDLTLNIGPGMFGLVGPNGAGKTTLMRILAGLLRPSSGRVRVFGHDLSTLGGRQAVRAILGYLPQDLGLYPGLNAIEFLDYMAVLKGMTDSAARRAQITRLLEQVRLADVARRPLRTYSGGMKRRVGIAQALLGDPHLIIVDEPTAGLDPEERVRFRNLLAEAAAGRTVLLSTHIVEDISQSCSALAALNAGALIYHGAPSALIAEARGHVWTLMTAGERPEDGLIVVSTRQLADGVQYRVVGQPTDARELQPAEPSLEDGYMWLMMRARAGAGV
jgi:ABC-2 type transport system ATP-binding protein